ncbi:deoxyribonuclease-2-beta-like, partial [Gastrophryne carolinensis]
VLLFNQQQGFWLSHSIPHFPPFPEHGFGYPDTGRFYGQNAFCMTFKFNQFKQIAAQLLYYNPYVYNCSIPIPFQDSLSNLNRICQGQIFPRIDRIRLAVLKSAGGESFLNFAKSKYLVDDIITGWMAQGLENDLLAETWLYKDWKLPSNCSLPWHVYNIERVSLASLSFYSRYDHSKWCVSRVYREGWICIGDLNRSPGQSWRSGGFICTQNKVMFSAFRKMVVYYEYCKAQAFTKE